MKVLFLGIWLLAGCIENKATVWAEAMYPGLSCTSMDTSSGCRPGWQDVANCRTKTETWQCSYREGTGGECKKVGDIPAELR